MSKEKPQPERQHRAGADKPATHSNAGDHNDAGDKLRAEAHHPTSRGRSGGHDGPRLTRASHNQGDGGSTARHLDVTPIKHVIRDGGQPKARSNEADKPLDARQSVDEHIKRGSFKAASPGEKRAEAKQSSDKPETGAKQPAEKRQEKATPNDRSDVSDRLAEVPRRTQPAEKVKVEYQDQANDPRDRVSRADFRIRKDGSVEVVKNPERHNNKEIVIEVERDQGEIGKPTEAQQKAIDQLTHYCAERFMNKNPDGTKAGTIEDHQGLVSDKVKASVKTRPEPEMSLPEPTRHQVENMRRFSGGGRGTMSGEQADSYFTPRDRAVPRRADETDRQWAIKEMVAGMANVRDSNPYEAVQPRGDRGLGVGRYVLTAEMLAEWLTDLLGDPMDPAKIEAAIKAGKISPKMAESIKSGKFQQFMDKLKNGEQPSPQELKDMLPREAQETIAGDLINKYSQALKDENGDVDLGKVALSMTIGHVVTDAEAARPEYKAFEEAAERLFSISEARTANPNRSLDWQDVNGRLRMAAKDSVGQAMWAKAGYSASALEYGNLGCAASVSSVMRMAGVDGGMKSAGVTNLESQILKNGGYRVSNPQPGDIVVGTGPKHGHIGIVGENGSVYHNSSARRQWVQASLNSVFLSGRFSDVHYLRLPSNDTQQA